MVLLTTVRSHISDVIPPSTKVEVDSAYCPRTLQFCDAASAASGNLPHKDGAGPKDCPVCFGPVCISIDETGADDAIRKLVCQYACTTGKQCGWTSRECGVVVCSDQLLECENDEASDQDLEVRRSAVIDEVTKKLEACLKERIDERNKLGDSIFESIVNMWNKREQTEERRKRMISVTPQQVSHDESWSLEALENSLLDKRKQLESPYIFTKDDSVAETNEIHQPEMQLLPTAAQVAAQMSITTRTPLRRADLFPLFVPYRARVSRRCRAELAAGRTGILVKPKLNPLEGDSSLRTGHGQWFKKDSSATQVVPRVQIVRKIHKERRYAVLLSVKNPTLSMVRLRFCGNDSQIVLGDDELREILVDPFNERRISAQLCQSFKNLGSTGFIELDPADDPFLDIGKEKRGDPPEVSGWEGTVIEDLENSGLKLVASQGDTSWVEFAVDFEEEVATNLVVPFSMQIEVGNGSWEASLVKRKELPEQEKDLVKLGLVAVL